MMAEGDNPRVQMPAGIEIVCFLKSECDFEDKDFLEL